MKLTLPNQYDFLPRFFKLSIANTVSNLMVPLAGFISLTFLGHLPEIRHLAGAAQAIIFFDFIYYAASFLRQSTTGVTSQAVGRNDREAVLLVGLRNGLIGLGLGVLILILQYPLQQLWFGVLSVAPEVKASGIAYFNARIWGAPAAVLNFVLIGWLLGCEESKKVLLLSALANIANVVLNYVFIIQWGWETTGAGLAEVVGQYLMLLGGLIFFCFQVEWKNLQTVFPKLWDLSALKSTFILNGNIFISTLILVSTLSFFNFQSTMLETTIYTEDVLLVQIVYIALYFFEGLGFSTESLAGNFKGQGVYQKLAPLLGISVGIGLVLGLAFALVPVLFPQTVFGLLTDHNEVIEDIDVYAWWLLSVLGFSSVAFLLEGYFLGLAEGLILRNMSLLSLGVGYLPVAGLAWKFHSNHLLWLSLSVFMATKMLTLAIQVPKTLKNDSFGTQGNEHLS